MSVNPLEAECRECDGKGHYLDFGYAPKVVKCPTCKGTGKVPATAPIEAQEAKCGSNGGQGIGASHDCHCTEKLGHKYKHICECGALWESAPHPEATQGELEACSHCSGENDEPGWIGSFSDDGYIGYHSCWKCNKGGDKKPLSEPRPAVQKNDRWIRCGGKCVCCDLAEAHFSNTATRMAVEARIETMKWRIKYLTSEIRRARIYLGGDEKAKPLVGQRSRLKVELAALQAQLKGLEGK